MAYLFILLRVGFFIFVFLFIYLFFVVPLSFITASDVTQKHFELFCLRSHISFLQPIKKLTVEVGEGSISAMFVLFH